MDKELMEQFQFLADMMEKMQAGIDENKHEILKTQIMLENTVSKKISSLFDGYTLNHEKQYELERRVEKLEQIVSDLLNKTA